MVQRFPPVTVLRHQQEMIKKFRETAHIRNSEVLRNVVHEYSRGIDYARKHPGLEWEDTVDFYEQIITIALTELLTRDTDK